jgi:hypothetical protein
LTYRSRAEIDHAQLTRITANLVQTEANFYRVSRELQRARSKSRSRSRSTRSRRQQTQVNEKLVSPRKHVRNIVNMNSTTIFDMLMFDLVVRNTSNKRQLSIHDDENKENVPQVGLSCR